MEAGTALGHMSSITFNYNDENSSFSIFFYKIIVKMVLCFLIFNLHVKYFSLIIQYTFTHLSKMD